MKPDSRTPDRLDGLVWPIATWAPSPLCPDLLRYEHIGEADGLRGRVVRGFFWLLRVWPPVETSHVRSAWLDG